MKIVFSFSWKKTKYYKIIDIDKEHAEPAKDNKNKIFFITLSKLNS